MFDAALLFLFAVIYAVIAWRMLDWAITLTVLFLPAYLIRFTIGPIPSTVLEIMLLVVIGVWGIRTFRERIRTRACPAFVPWRWILAAWVAVGVLAVVISPDLRSALGLWKAYIVEPTLFFLVCVNVIRTRQQLYQVLWALGASAVLIGFVAMLQYLSIFPIPSPYGLEVPMRATSVFPFPTAIGKLLGPVAGLFFGLLLVNRRWWRGSLWRTVREHLFVAGVLVFSLMALLFSVSRGALIGVLMAVIFISFFSYWKKWIWLGIIGVVIGGLLVPQIRSNVTSVFDASDVSADVHQVMWKGAIRIIQDHPLLGTGLASFPIVYADYKEASHTEFFPNPDQLVLSLWIEMGLLGVLVFICIMMRYFQTAAAAMRVDRALAVGLMAAMVVLLVHGMVDTPYFKNDLAVQFWVLGGMVVALARLPKKETAQSEH
ncbi:MAG: O-antigen ligase family protein [Patescibacteria group bacterium]|jgi:putative inorganic carbon (HCO3(-)) transporter